MSRRPVQSILEEICNEPHARLMSFVRSTYSVCEISGVTIRVTPEEHTHLAQESAVACLFGVGTPEGEVVVIRDSLDGTIRLPETTIAIDKSWRPPRWVRVLEEIRNKFKGLTGRELLLPEPVAHTQVKYVAPGKKMIARDVIVFTGQAGPLDAGLHNPSFLLRNLPALKTDFPKTCAMPAVARLRTMLPFPEEEVHSFAAPGRLSRAIRNQARSLLRLTPQPHKEWLRRQICDLLRSGDAVIDLAGGDDRIMLEVARKRPDVRVFVNDVIWGELTRTAALSIQAGVVLVNHDLRSFPAMTFDLAVLKNCLHHLRRAEDQFALVDVLPRIAKKVVIVEIEDPRRSLLHRFWHRCIYTDDPATDGDAFYCYDQFQAVLKGVFGERLESISVDRKWTIRGSYLLAELHFQQPHEEGGINGIPDDARGRGRAAKEDRCTGGQAPCLPQGKGLCRGGWRKRMA